MKKKLSIALLAFSLAMICANFLVRRIGKFLPPPQQEMEEEKEFSPFAQIKEDNGETIKGNLLVTQTQENFEQEKDIIKPILKTELTEEEKQTVENYSKNPKMQEFIKEISAAIPAEELNEENYLQIVYKPEVRNIFEKYSQDEDFRKMATEIMRNKDFLQFAEKLVNNSEVKK
ncbi:MAG: hypothetical protein J5594_01915 [Elusimicrobiaceae bacterium]|nr:hypothetical protein [Elusimicrobiaceae bacterium]